MKKKIVSATLAFLSTSALASITIHDPVSFSNKTEKNGAIVESVEIVRARGREMSLEIALPQVMPMMQIVYIEPSLKDLAVSWRADGEHYERVITRLSRQYPIDIVVNESSETVYVDVDKGQCEPHRELKLDELARAWEKLNIQDQPVLPPILPVHADLAGYQFRMC